MRTVTKEDVKIVKSKLNLNQKSKILNVSHYGCMDGSCSSIPIYNAFDNVNYIRAKFNNVDKIANKIDYDKYDAVIFTDISPSDPSVIKTPKNVIMIDHHESAIVNHDPDNMRFVYIGESACLLTKKFISMYFNTDIKYLDVLCNHVNNYDMWIDPHNKNWHFNLLHYYYLKKDRFTHVKFIQRFCNGDVEFNEEELAHIRKREQELEQTWKKVQENYYDLPYNINGCLVFENDFVNEITHKLMDKFGFEIAINKNPRSFQCSVRCETPDVPIGDVLQELGLGGGHDNAGGFADENKADFRNNLEKLCKHLHDNYESIRR